MAQEIADSTLLDTWGSGGNIVEPDISKIIEGWQLGEQPPHEYMNWLQNTFGSKLNHILKNGVASWNNTTQYLAGSSVQHNGNVWLCKTTNTNSEPADVNANWKRIITVESLTTVLAGYVATTGDQDIDDIKTFLKSPIVPTPTTGTQAVNKDYVDSKPTLSTGAILNGYTILDNCIVAFGGEFNRADYPKLWAYLQANTSLVKTQAQWTTESTTNGGICGFFSDGDGGVWTKNRFGDERIDFHFIGRFYAETEVSFGVSGGNGCRIFDPGFANGKAQQTANSAAHQVAGFDLEPYGIH